MNIRALQKPCTLPIDPHSSAHSFPRLTVTRTFLYLIQLVWKVNDVYVSLQLHAWQEQTAVNALANSWHLFFFCDDDFSFLYLRDVTSRNRRHVVKYDWSGGTERESLGVGRDMSCPRKLFLVERKSVYSGGSLSSETSVCSLPSLWSF